MNDIPACPGIYKITCIVNGRFYIGSSFDMCERKNQHWDGLRQNTHFNPHLQNAWNKYGEQAFVFEVVEPVLETFRYMREQYWLDTLKPFGRKGFNINRNAEAPPSWKGKNHSDETRAKISKAAIGNKRPLGHKHTDESLAKMRQIQGSPEVRARKSRESTGRKHTAEAREKIRQATLGHPGYTRGKKLSSEACEKIGNAHRGKTISSEHKEKLRQSHLGKSLSDETKAKLRIAQQARRAREKEVY